MKELLFSVVVIGIVLALIGELLVVKARRSHGRLPEDIQ